MEQAVNQALNQTLNQTNNHLLAPKAQGLYRPSNERDGCGVGFVAHIKGKKSHQIVQQGLALLTNLTHRGATGYDPKQMCIRDRQMLDSGIYLGPSAFEAGFVSAAHSDEDIAKTLNAAKVAFSSIKI